jgi:glycosyltransferase involved in cell wall biosynthesis
VTSWSWNLPAAKTDDPSFISIVVTVRNEERHLAALLTSLRRQEPPFEIVLVDAFSDDRTWTIAQAFAQEHPDLLRAFQRKGHRGDGRNAGVELARGSRVAFIDGDCEADPTWLREIRKGFERAPVVAGKTVVEGPPAFRGLERVALYHRGMDVTYPSCNLGYDRDLFRRLGGFDGRFITAEDIDLNLRAVRGGAALLYVPEAVVRHHTRDTVLRFLLQAFWNGYGRKQLTEKQGQLWASYRYRKMLQTQASPLAYARLAAALVGYFTRLVTVSGTPQRIPQDPGSGPTAGRSAAANSHS